jgi:arylsulfatase A-like enzyme/Flp pilus assembly protein TadD
MRGSAAVSLCLPAAVALASLAGAPARSARPSLVLVTLDTTRSDHLGCHGARSARTPVIDGLARGGTRFARAISASPLTLPAHASLMTGLDPPEHGLRDNGFGVLPAAVPTLAEALSAEGYRTAAFVASRVLDRRFGLARGFDRYDDQMAAEDVGEYGYPERDAAKVTAAALSWLAGLPKAETRPYFLWVHYYDAHAPYEPPPAWRGDTPEANYAGEIGYVDSEIGRLLASLPARDHGRIVALAGDHGEGLGEHGEKGHGIFLYRSVLEVPLILEGAGVPRGKVVGDVVATRALAPTLLRLLGLGGAADRFGAPLPDLSMGGTKPAALPIYSETLMTATAYAWSPLKAVSDERWRLIVAPREELYDYVADPGEVRNRISDRPEVAARLKQGLEAREAAMRPKAPSVARPAPDVAASLRTLGYLSGQSAAPEDLVVGGIDPKDGLPMLAEFEKATKDLDEGRSGAALRTLEALVQRNPGNVPFLNRLASAQLASGSQDKAVDTYRRALAQNPSSDFLHLHLADALFELGRTTEARSEYRAALELNPRLAKAWMALAEMAMKQGGNVEERKILGEAVAAGTDSAAVFTRQAQLDQAAGDLESADRALRRASELTPDWALPWLVWGDLAERQGRSSDALDRYRRASALAPDSAEAREARRRIERLERGR